MREDQLVAGCLFASYITFDISPELAEILATLRSILKALGRNAKLSLSVALSIPGFLKIEVEYARDLGSGPIDQPVVP